MSVMTRTDTSMSSRACISVRKACTSRASGMGKLRSTSAVSGWLRSEKSWYCRWGLGAAKRGSVLAEATMCVWSAMEMPQSTFSFSGDLKMSTALNLDNMFVLTCLPSSSEIGLKERVAVCAGRDPATVASSLFTSTIGEGWCKSAGVPRRATAISDSAFRASAACAFASSVNTGLSVPALEEKRRREGDAGMLRESSIARPG
mmetsp:Transcript_6918/g.20467  ORF Transcript_6918/g.20467 Transcript_6918/m.20467 type:complete len:203 (+) Transcript_6918:533-1141(+)